MKIVPPPSPFDAAMHLPYWERDMELDIEPWVAYGCDFRPVMVNELFSEQLGHIAKMAFCVGSEFLYMESDGCCPVGTLVPENLIRPRARAVVSSNFVMLFAYSRKIEGVLCRLSDRDTCYGIGITICGIRKNSILLDACKVIVVASENPLFDSERFLAQLTGELETESAAASSPGIPYFAEKLGYRRCCIPYETDDIVQMEIRKLIRGFEFDETRRFVGPVLELSLEDF